MQGMTLAVGQRTIEGAEPNRQLLFAAVRHQATWVFAYAMAIIPLAIAALLLHILFLARPGRDEPVTHLLLNVAAAMIAVLPLRQVLVPQEITGLTRVDLLLGF